MAGRQAAESSVFFRLWDLIRGGLCALYRRLGLERLFGGSIFLCLTLWCSAAVVLAPLLPTMAVLALAAVAFAYVTNKPFVFKSHDWSMKTVFPELGKFVGCRAASGGLETVLILLTVDILGWNGNIWKLIISVLVVILNYVSSKLLVFRK